MAIRSLRGPTARTKSKVSPGDGRLLILRGVMLLGFLAVAGRLFVLQVLSHGFYSSLASEQQGFWSNLVPERGSVFLSDPKSDDGRFPAAINRNTFVAFADTKSLKDPADAAKKLSPVLGLAEGDLLLLMSKKDDPYIPLAKDLNDDNAEKVRTLGIHGIGLAKTQQRFYPEGSTLAHITGFVGSDAKRGRTGKYGIEGFMEKQLAGENGSLSADGTGDFRPAKDGAEVTLTIDRSIQFVACQKLQEDVVKFGAAGGSVVIANPKTGAILALCNVPTFDPNAFAKTEDVSVFNDDAIFRAYEPGSVFKPLIMAAAIDAGLVTPNTTFDDTGAVKIGPFTIRNSDLAAHGTQTMTQVLEKSLNTGMIWVSAKLGPDAMKKYVQAFGFGKQTGIELNSEVAGSIESLSKKGDIWSATASFGQGITVTPVQLVAAYGALANGGKLMKPYIVASVKRPDGRVDKTEPQQVRQVVTERTASLLGGMLVDVVENGHGKHAAVPGYWVGGKTGTAQISAGASGYVKDAAIGSFVGYAPIDDPQFVMAVKLTKPTNVAWAESSAAPLFGDIAKFLVQYLQIPPERKN
ncbi:MAG: hypothetical protein RLZZ324_347 [Candidatus Parcubacteria bacterium]|jgi:cell division protein FtsI/penicillin-binding protein 2